MLKRAVVFAFFGSQDQEAADKIKTLIAKLPIPSDYEKELLPLSQEKIEEVRNKLLSIGVEEVIFLSLILENGRTYQKLLTNGDKWKSFFPLVKVTKPLLSDEGDYQKLGESLSSTPKKRLLVLHGKADSVSLAATYINKKESTLRACTIQGKPQLEEVIQRGKKESIEVYPVLLAGAHHTHVDILGKEESSLFKRLEKLGYQPILSQRSFIEEPFLLSLIQEKLKEEL